jgi:hypothetical protein
LSSSKVPIWVRRPRAPVLPFPGLRDPRIRYSKPTNFESCDIEAQDLEAKSIESNTGTGDLKVGTWLDMLVSAAAIRFHLHNVAFSSSLSGVDGEEGDHHVLVGTASVPGFDEMEAIEGLKPSSELLRDFF